MANASMFDFENLKDLKGSATYTGQAAGYYATRAAGSAEATSGRFTATATLKANFDAAAGTVGPNGSGELTAGNFGGAGQPSSLDKDRKAYTITNDNPAEGVVYIRPPVVAPGVSLAGSKIHDFMAEDGTAMAGWVVNLNAAALRQPGDVMVDGTDDNGRREDYIDALNAAKAAGMLEGTTSGTGYAMEWTGVWDASFHGTNTATLPTGVVGTFQAEAGSANPTEVDGAIDLYKDGGFAGVVGSFGARR